MVELVVALGLLETLELVVYRLPIRPITDTATAPSLKEDNNP
jgi:hypothetical protein